MFGIKRLQIKYSWKYLGNFKKHEIFFIMVTGLTILIEITFLGRSDSHSKYELRISLVK